MIFTDAGTSYLTHPYPTHGTNKNRIAARTQQRHFDSKLLMLTLFFANPFDISIIVGAKPNISLLQKFILALNQLNYALFKIS